MTIPLATIGYESAPQARVIDALKAAGVQVLIDVRAVAAPIWWPKATQPNTIGPSRSPKDSVVIPTTTQA